MSPQPQWCKITRQEITQNIHIGLILGLNVRLGNFKTYDVLSSGGV